MSNNGKGQHQKIQLVTALLIWLPYWACPETSELKKAEIQKLHAKNIIKLKQLEWNVPIVSVPQKDGSIQLCVIYRIYNAEIKRVFYSITNMKDFIPTLLKATDLSTLVASSQYWKIDTDNGDKGKTALHPITVFTSTDAISAKKSTWKLQTHHKRDIFQR